ncbi:MAG: hypothetical protein ACPG6P_14075, partial [Akkermansiaceae bacterium]
DVSNVGEDLLWPMVKVVLVAVFAFFPLVLYTFFIQPGNPTIGLLLLLGGIIYFPMAILSVAVLGYLGAMSPHIVIPGIFKMGWRYWLAVVLLYLIYSLQGFVSNALQGNIILGTLIMGLIGMYVLMTGGRILGLIYKEREEQLGWL